MEKMERLIKELETQGVALQLMDRRGVILYPAVQRDKSDPDFSALIWNGEVAVGTGFSYCRLGRDILRFAQADQLLVLCAVARVCAGESGEEAGVTRESLFTRILHVGYLPDEMDASLAQLGLDTDTERCVVVFSVREETGTLMRTLGELFGEKSPDVVLCRRAGTVVLIKAMKGTTQPELTELAMAVAETMGEGGVEISVGVGEPKKGLALLRESYLEAVRALDLGRVFHPDHMVHLYRQMILERLVTEIPPDVALRYHQILFSRKNVRLLNEEMIATIDRFFACNLNLSETARQLYIHRNTLVYRLDKFQKATGLDLRVFDDAVAFKLLRMMGNVPVKRVN